MKFKSSDHRRWFAMPGFPAVSLGFASLVDNVIRLAVISALPSWQNVFFDMAGIRKAARGCNSVVCYISVFKKMSYGLFCK
jgi:hypothetical protein